jgi:hypothetical protein
MKAALSAKQIEEERRTTRDLLSLVGVKVPLIVMRTWNGWETELAGDWAAATHLQASDNAVRTTAPPRCLRPYLRATAGGGR